MLLHLRAESFFDGSPLTARAVKSALERSIRLSRDVMPAAFPAVAGVAELDGRAADVSGIEVVGDGQVRIRMTFLFPSCRRS
jgi:ABC-type transport system substrate-binding protein